MLITETVTIKPDSINKLSLAELVMLQYKFGYVRYKFSNVVSLLIILKKLSNYLKNNPENHISKLSLSDIIRKIRKIYSNNDITSMLPAYTDFILNFKLRHRVSGNFSFLFLIDNIIIELNETLKGESDGI